MKKISLRIQFIIAMVLLFGFFFILPLNYHHTYCSASIGAGKIDSAQSPQAKQYSPKNKPTVAHKQKTATSNYKTSEGKEGGQIHPWICDYHLTDVLLLYFTACLVVIGYFTMTSTDKAVKDLERAFVFAGPSPPATIDADGLIKCSVVAGNYGRTAGILKELYVEFSETEPTGKIAKYEVEKGKLVRLDTGVQAGVNNSGVSLIIDTIKSTKPNAPYCFGYIKYLDIFNNMHINRFSVKIEITEAGSLPVAGSPAYNSMD